LRERGSRLPTQITIVVARQAKSRAASVVHATASTRNRRGPSRLRSPALPVARGRRPWPTHSTSLPALDRCSESARSDPQTRHRAGFLRADPGLDPPPSRFTPQIRRVRVTSGEIA
jgi:hypothetical protein